MGLECSGYLIEEGEINLSKRVMAIVPGGGYGEYVAVKKNHVIPVPESIDLTDAAAIPEAWITAYQLCKIADIKKDDFVLIHAAASGVGTALIQLINLYKGNSICIVSNNEKLHLCQQLGQGSVHGMLRKELNRINSINNVTDHKNCSVIFDCVGASEFNHNIEAAALDCRWVCYGFLGGSKLAEFDMAKLMSKRINMFYTTLRNRTDDYKAELTKNFIEEILPKFASKELSTVIDTVYEGVENIKAAHHKMEHNLNKGKLIVKWH